MEAVSQTLCVLLLCKVALALGEDASPFISRCFMFIFDILYHGFFIFLFRIVAFDGNTVKRQSATKQKINTIIEN